MDVGSLGLFVDQMRQINGPNAKIVLCFSTAYNLKCLPAVVALYNITAIVSESWHKKPGEMTPQRSNLNKSLRITSHRSSRDESANNSKLVPHLKRTKGLLELGSPSKTGAGFKVKRTKKIANLRGEFSSLAKSTKSITHEKGSACDLDKESSPFADTKVGLGQDRVTLQALDDKERIEEETRLQRERMNGERLRDLAARILGRPRTVFESGGPDRS